MNESNASLKASESRGEAIGFGLTYYFLTSVIVALGVLLGVEYLEQSSSQGHKFQYAGEAYANWDGQWYKKITKSGYNYTVGSYSSVAFFPAYPLLARWLVLTTGLRPEIALIVVANAFLIVLFCLSARYIQLRFPGSPRRLTEYALLSMGLVPTSFFFRMAYSESMFMALIVLTLYAMTRRWPLTIVAAIIGLATATRPLGVGLIPSFVLHLWHTSSTKRAFATKIVLLLPITCWGLAAYMAYQYAAFGDALAFVRTQSNWKHRPSPSVGNKVVALATGEPIRSLYNPSSSGYWARSTRHRDPIFSLRVADPLYFIGAIALVVFGASKSWLSGYEILAAAALLLIPYVTTGYEQYVQSIGRYSAAVFPVYLVTGRLLCDTPSPIVAAVASLSGFFLGVYSAMFAAWYVFL
jgi:hypothetical protein